MKIDLSNVSKEELDDYNTVLDCDFDAIIEDTEEQRYVKAIIEDYKEDEEYLLEHTKKLDLFNDPDRCVDKELAVSIENGTKHTLNISESLATTLVDDLNEPEVYNSLELLTGLIPNIKGNCKNIVNDFLTSEKPKLTSIGKSFYTSDLIIGLPKDTESKKLYASVVNQLLAFNIINDLYGRMPAKFSIRLDFSTAPKWIDKEELTKLIVYTLRSRDINAFELRKQGAVMIFVETITTELGLRDKVKKCVSYVKNVITKLIDKDAYEIFDVNVGTLANHLSRALIVDKMGKMQQYLYDGADKLAVIEEQQEELKYLKEEKDQYLPTHLYNIMHTSLMKLCGALYNQGHCSYTGDYTVDFSQILKSASVVLNTNYIEILNELHTIHHKQMDELDNNETKVVQLFRNKICDKMLNGIHYYISNYKDTYLQLDTNLTENSKLIYERRMSVG